jgi:hypothetical protein
LLKAIRTYFALERPEFGGRAAVISEFFLFSGVVAGTVGRWLISVLEQEALNWKGLIVGLIAAVITFPAIYDKVGMKRSDQTFVKWCVAFEQVGKAIK